ncbi:MAG TPA: hypothetical protein VFP48_02915 [Steroidobacteraceae bacterium]|nr:hypothetical protein [Steroidobacteraceae bacterium]
MTRAANEVTVAGTLSRFAWALGLMLASVVAFAEATYEVRVESELNGLDVKISTVENPGGLIVQLRNDSPQKVRCTLRLDAQPQPLVRKTVYVAPGKSEDAVFAAKRKWFEADVRVECEPADPGT